MKNVQSYLFVLGCALVSLSSYALAASLQFGAVETGTISSPGQSIIYTLSANANDVVDFTVVTTSGTLVPKIVVYDPNGKEITSANPPNCNGSTVELNTVVLQLGGTYTAIVSDCSSTKTGSYALYSQRTNNPSGPVNLPFGQTQTGTISSPAQSNTYTFTANANDIVDFAIVTTSGNLSPKLRVYSPSGQQVAFNNPPNCNGSTIELNTGTVPATGTYTVLLGDCSDKNTGNYDIYAQRTNNPAGAMNLPFGQTQTGTISSPAQSNTYTFSASANAVVDFTIVTTTGKLSPKIRVYSPSGQQIASNNPPNCNGATIELNIVALTVSGTYTALVGDCSDTNTGNYDIYMQMTENPLGAGNLPFGQTRTGTIGLPSQSNTYTFGANASDVIDFAMVTTSGNLSPKIRLYNGKGQQIAANNPPNCNGSTIELNTGTLPASDIYTVLVGDCSDTNTGNYVIYLQRTDNPSGAAMLLLGQTQSGNVASKAQSVSYVFYGSAADVIDLTMVTTSGSLSPKVRVYNPAGQQIASDNPPNCNGSTIDLNTGPLPQVSGVYKVLVGDCSDTNTGNYVIYAQRTNSSFGPVALLFGGQTQTGNIVSQAQSNTFSFSGAANNVVDFTMVTTNGTLSPKIRLYNPAGQQIASANPPNCNGSTVQLNSVTLPRDGIYTVLTGDCSDTKTGTYNLSGLCFGTCLVMPAITWATPAPITHPRPLSAMQLDASSPVAGTFTYNPAAGTVPGAGPQNLSVTFTPSDTALYSTAVDSVQLLVKSAVKVTLSPSSLSFGNQALNTTSAAGSVTLTNIGTATLDISGITISADFAISANTCGTTLPARMTCQVSVTFTPTQLGSLAGALRFDDNVPTSPQTVSLSGTGVKP
jgi:hypothetical protein